MASKSRADYFFEGNLAELKDALGFNGSGD